HAELLLREVRGEPPGEFLLTGLPRTRLEQAPRGGGRAFRGHGAAELLVEERSLARRIERFPPERVGVADRLRDLLRQRVELFRAARGHLLACGLGLRQD